MTTPIIFVTLIFVYALLSKRVSETPITAPIMFTGAGMIMYSAWEHIAKAGMTPNIFLRLAEIGLVLLLFTDASRTDLLRETGCVQGDTALATLRGDQVPGVLVSELDRYAQRYWPAPWGRCISWAMTHGQVVGTPVAEYLPPRLVRGRVALVGDAAHVASPMTGAGFRNALLDVAALAACLDSAEPASVPAGLARYQHERLPLARQLVSSGMSWGHSCLS